jgi:hypothetical protein
MIARTSTRWDVAPGHPESWTGPPGPMRRACGRMRTPDRRRPGSQLTTGIALSNPPGRIE